MIEMVPDTKRDMRAMLASPLHLNINTHDVPNGERVILRNGEAGLR